MQDLEGLPGQIVDDLRRYGFDMSRCHLSVERRRFKGIVYSPIMYGEEVLELQVHPSAWALVCRSPSIPENHGGWCVLTWWMYLDGTIELDSRMHEFLTGRWP